MNARCPADPTHKTFITVAHVSEDWLVDEDGNWIKTVAQGEVTQKPQPGNVWTCATCQTEAEVE